MDEVITWLNHLSADEFIGVCFLAVVAVVAICSVFKD